MKKVAKFFSIIFYMAAFVSVAFYFSAEYVLDFSFSPVERLIVLFFSCVVMYFAAVIYSAGDNDAKSRKLLFKANAVAWLIMFTALILNFTLFDGYFGRNGFTVPEVSADVLEERFCETVNLIPFKTVYYYIKGFLNGSVSERTFIINIIGNLTVFMPYAFLLPLVFKRQNKFRNFLVTMILFVSLIEAAQFITMSGSCDIDDLILNVFGACLLHAFLHIKAINRLIGKVFLCETGEQRKSKKSN